jgi:AraC family transcriptional regulator, alkane utilization regulator
MLEGLNAPRPPNMDVLTHVLRTVRLRGSVFFTAEFSSPWALESPDAERLAPVVMPNAEHVSLFHIAVEGRCIVECGTGVTIDLDAGDVVVFPHGSPHTMRSEGDARATRLDHVFSRASPDVLPVVSLGGGGRRTRLICGYLNCNQHFRPLFEALPTALVVRRRSRYRAVEAIGDGGRAPVRVPHESSTWLGTTLKFTVNEALAARPGRVAMLGCLAELMFVEIVREYVQQLESGECGWLATLEDPHVGTALRLLHANPARSWTVASLAHEVATSRSALAHRFTALLGEPPMKYLACWRMHLARQMLRDSGDNIQAIAERIGYESEAAFNRAFKKATGRPPAAWRRAAAHVPGES